MSYKKSGSSGKAKAQSEHESLMARWSIADRQFATLRADMIGCGREVFAVTPSERFGGQSVKQAVASGDHAAESWCYACYRFGPDGGLAVLSLARAWGWSVTMPAEARRRFIYDNARRIVAAAESQG